MQKLLKTLMPILIHSVVVSVHHRWVHEPPSWGSDWPHATRVLEGRKLYTDQRCIWKILIFSNDADGSPARDLQGPERPGTHTYDTIRRLNSWFPSTRTEMQFGWSCIKDSSFNCKVHFYKTKCVSNSGECLHKETPVLVHLREGQLEAQLGG